MIAGVSLIGALGFLIGYQFMKNRKPLPLIWRGVVCFGLGIAVIALFWTPNQGVQNIGFVPAGLLFILGLVYEVRGLLDKQ